MNIKKILEAMGWLTAILLLIYASHAVVFAQAANALSTDNASVQVKETAAEIAPVEKNSRAKR
ncbi:MAG TPA: hypothetical protein VF666_21780 [Pyrinomonadaceae bacterium]|jgi:hypothetical protein